VAVPAPWLADLERTLAEGDEDSLAIAVVVLASVAGAGMPLEGEERDGAVRRALLLLAAGGDPNRGLDLGGRAVGALATDLDDPDRREILTSGLAELAAEAQGLPHASEALRGLLDAPEIAWRAYACSLLAAALGADD
jgi:hypothetical protein